MVKIRIGIVLALFSFLSLCFVVINKNLTGVEIVAISMFCLGLIIFGILIEQKGGFFSHLKEEFNEERKF